MIGPRDPDLHQVRWGLSFGRHRWRFTLGALAVLLALVVLLPRHHAVSTSLPSGGWGRTIACLERDQSYRVTDLRTGAVPDAGSRTIVVHAVVRGLELAALRDAGTPADARATVRTNGLGELYHSNYRTFGSIVWAYAENGDPPKVSASAGDETLISFCVRTPDRR